MLSRLISKRTGLAFPPAQISFAILVAICSAFAEASPLPLSSGGQSVTSRMLSGGGAAADLGATAVSVNPAALGAAEGWEAESGLLDLGHSGAPFAALRGPADIGAYGLEYYTPEGGAGFLQGLLAAYAAPLWKGPWGGITLRSEKIEDRLGVDADLGLFQKFGPFAWGAALRRALASGTAYDTVAQAGPRLLQSGVAWDPVMPGFFHPGFRYDFTSDDFSPLTIDHSASIGCNILPGGGLRIVASAHVPQRHPDQFGWAAGFNTHTHHSRAVFEFHYALAYRVPEAPGGLRLAVSLQMQWLPLRDRVPPQVRLTVDKAAWIPGPNAKPLSFQLEVHDNLNQPKAWKLSLARAFADGQAGSREHLFAGDGLPPRIIQWNGDNDSGFALPAGLYLAQLWAEDADGNSAVTPWVMISVGGSAPSAAAVPDSMAAAVRPDASTLQDSSRAADPFAQP